MNVSLVKSILSLFNDNITKNIAEQTGETQFSIKKSLESIIPIIMRGLVSKSAEGPEMVNKIFETAKSATDSSWWQQLSDFFTQSDMMDKGKEILHDLFGGNDNIQRIAGGVASHSNIKLSSALTIMQVAAPLCLGAVGKKIAERNIATSDLSSWFETQKNDFDVPLNLNEGKIPERVQINNHKSYEEEKKKNFYLWPLLLALLVIGVLAWFFLKGCNKGETSNEKNTEKTESAIGVPTFKLDADSTAVYDYGDTITLNLPNNIAITVGNNSAEATLYNKILEAVEDGLDTSEAGKAADWINLYDVQFTKGLEYRKSAEEQIKNISMLLKAFPEVHLKIGGYTDATGSGEINKKISQQRAEKVAEELTRLGVGSQVSGSEGYGPEFPIASNNTAEGRAQNRRVSCRIVALDK
jgi:outer membrane protein OmpA-like peptidoglycan-associated protein